MRQLLPPVAALFLGACSSLGFEAEVTNKTPLTPPVVYATWSAPHDIVIVLGYEGDETIVRREILHDLLGGDPDHFDVAWTRCDLLVD